MDEPEMKEIAGIIGDVLRRPGDESVKKAARQTVHDLMERFPAYPG
jgi:glycine/serine hydroxymethyltransferase